MIRFPFQCDTGTHGNVFKMARTKYKCQKTQRAIVTRTRFGRRCTKWTTTQKTNERSVHIYGTLHVGFILVR